MHAIASLEIEIWCRKLPGTRFNERVNVRLGLQLGDEVVNDIAGNSLGAKFTAVVDVFESHGEHRLDFRGPAVHGKPGDRFIYLSWGERMGNDWQMFRRAKLKVTAPLNLLAHQAIESQLPVVAEIDMTDDRGEPLCGSIKSNDVRWSV